MSPDACQADHSLVNWSASRFSLTHTGHDAWSATGVTPSSLVNVRPQSGGPADARLRTGLRAPPAGLSSDLPKVETNGKPGRQASRSTRGTCVARRTDRIRMVAARADATAAMAHAAIEAARPGLFVIKYSNATIWDEPKKTE